MFSLEIATILAKICCATYESKPHLSENAALLSNRRLIEFNDDSFSVIALSGIKDGELIIAFQGTTLAKLNQETNIWLNMLTCMIINFFPLLMNSTNEHQIKNIYGGEVHLGFSLLIENILPEVKSFLKESKPRRICLTGHSLGGALATLAAYRLKQENFPINRVYTFGAPCVGDSIFASIYKEYKIPHFRIENKSDIIPHLPPDDETKSRIELTTKFLNNILTFFKQLNCTIPLNELSLQIPNLNYKHVGDLKFLHWNGNINEYSHSLREERLSHIPKRFEIIGSYILTDHSIELYYQSLDNCRLREEEINPMKNSYKKVEYNIVTLGKTGVGKSALINYLYRQDIPKTQDIAETGVGLPVTQIDFKSYRFDWNSIPINIYDSKGLEVNNSETWIKRLKEELKKHGTDRPVHEWFHTVFYCINAGSHRIELFELETIKLLINEKYRVIIVLTNSDVVDDIDIEKLKNTIYLFSRKENISLAIPIIPVCSVYKTRKKVLSEPFGKEELQNQTLKGFWNAITIRLPDRCESELHKEVEKWREEQSEYLKNSTNLFGLIGGEVKETIQNNFRIFLNNLEKTRYNIVVNELKEIVYYYTKLAEMLKYPPPEDLPVFKVGKEKIQVIFVTELAEYFRKKQQVFLTFLADILTTFVPDKPSFQKQIDTLCNRLTMEITQQKNEISRLIENMIQKVNKT